ncbi:unnamed protein product [Paramecium pentaurelia]|uniref:Transmembrane protein n=1 Tax=Paramecium pentaurelia TaxID=43138 RepID=A0A8S1U9N7_9CILI|nr:unnamed protein product [Paramecium pentaurelia]
MYLFQCLKLDFKNQIYVRKLIFCYSQIEENHIQLFQITLTISPLMEAFRFQTFFDSLNGNRKYVIEASNNFKKDNINAYFFDNLKASRSAQLQHISVFLYVSQQNLFKYIYLNSHFQLANYLQILKNNQTLKYLIFIIMQFQDCSSLTLMILVLHVPFKWHILLLKRIIFLQINYYLSFLFYRGVSFFQSLFLIHKPLSNQFEYMKNFNH